MSHIQRNFIPTTHVASISSSAACLSPPWRTVIAHVLQNKKKEPSFISHQQQAQTVNVYSKHKKRMSIQNSPSLSTLPIELVYRILNHLRPYNILMSTCNVCVRLDSIIDTYEPYQVKLIYANSKNLLITCIVDVYYMVFKDWES